MRPTRLPINDAAEHAAMQNVWHESSRHKVTDSVHGNTFHGGISCQIPGSKGKLFLLSRINFLKRGIFENLLRLFHHLTRLVAVK